MSLLRRSDDRDRNLRRRAPRAIAIAEPNQDRHLMSDGAVLSPSQPRSPSTPANAGPSWRCSFAAPRPSPSAELTPRPYRAAANQARWPRPNSRNHTPPALAAIPALSPRPSNPHSSRSPRQSLFLPAVSSQGGFRTPAPRPRARSCWGRRPKPFTQAEVLAPRRRSAWRKYRSFAEGFANGLD